MKRVVRFTIFLLCLGVIASRVSAYTSLWIFGDTVSTTTNGPGTSLYYGKRYSNGNVWVEDLAQFQGITFVDSHNWSYFGLTTTNFVLHVNAFTTPGDSSTALYVVWVMNADITYACQNFGTTMSKWTNMINYAQSNIITGVNGLYAKGARTIVMPPAVDFSKVPNYRLNPNAAFFSARCGDFNVSFSNTVTQLRTAHPDLKIYMPDFAALLNLFWSNASTYGLTNSGVDAVSDPNLTDKSFTGPGSRYIFWDYLGDPTAKVHTYMAQFAQQMISPVQPVITKLTLQGANNRLDVSGIPIARDGSVLSCQTFGTWSTVLAIPNGTNTTRSLTVPASSSNPLYYRIKF